MIDLNKAVSIAKDKAMEVFQTSGPWRLEEVEREVYNKRDVWALTLSFPREVHHMNDLAKMWGDPLQYKRFYIDVASGDVLAIKIRELARG